MIQRVLMACINYDHPQRGMEHALRGLFGEANVSNFDFCAHQRKQVGIEAINHRFIESALEFRPDWIWLQVQDTQILRAESVYAIKQALPNVVVTHWNGDLRPTISPYQASFCQACDITFISNKGQIPLYEKAGARKVLYCQIGLDWEEDVLGIRPLRREFPAVDVVFCGNYYGDRFPGTKDRIEAISTLVNSGVRVGVIGGGWPSSFPVLGLCHVKEQIHVYRNAKVVLSINHFNDIANYYSDRHLIALASGTPVVSRYVPALDEEFAHGHDLLWYRDMNDLQQCVDSLLNSPTLRGFIGRNGRTLAMKKHSWWQRFLEVLPHIEDAQSSAESPIPLSQRSC